MQKGRYIDPLLEMKRKWDNEAILAHREEIGEARGEAKGKREAKLEAAKNFKSLGISIEMIAVGTGLTVEEIEQL